MLRSGVLNSRRAPASDPHGCFLLSQLYWLSAPAITCWPTNGVIDPSALAALLWPWHTKAPDAATRPVPSVDKNEIAVAVLSRRRRYAVPLVYLVRLARLVHHAIRLGPAVIDVLPATERRGHALNVMFTGRRIRARVTCLPRTSTMPMNAAAGRAVVLPALLDMSLEEPRSQIRCASRSS